MKKKDRNYLLFIEDMIVNLTHALEYTHGMDFNAFCNDNKTQDAVVRCLEISGEAAKNIPEDVKLRNVEIDWDLMYLFRNKVAHHYFDVDLSVVWEIVVNELPKDVENLKLILKREEEVFDKK